MIFAFCTKIGCVLVLRTDKDSQQPEKIAALIALLDIEKFFESGRSYNHSTCRKCCSVNSNGNRNCAYSSASRYSDICAEVYKIVSFAIITPTAVAGTKEFPSPLAGVEVLISAVRFAVAEISILPLEYKFAVSPIVTEALLVFLA